MQLEVYVHGDISEMDASRVLAGLKHLVDLVKALGGGPVQFTHLKDSSVDTGLRPLRAPEETNRAFRQVVADLRTVEDSPTLPDDWDESVIQDGRGVSDCLGTFTDAGARLTLRDGDRIVDQVRVTKATRDHLKQVTEPKRPTIGSVIGRLDSLSLHERREARLWPDRGGNSVVIRFTAAQVDEVREVVGRRVEARGKLVRDYRGRPVSLQLRAISRLNTRDESPRLGTGAGIAPDAVTSSVKEYLGDVRGTA